MGILSVGARSVLAAFLTALCAGVVASADGSRPATPREEREREENPAGAFTAPPAVPELPLSALPAMDRSFELAAGMSFRSLGVVKLEDFVRKLGSDRRLLIEVRKEVPQNADEAAMYLARLKQLAQQSDPVRLVPVANKVLEQSSIYFDWLATEFESEEEQAREYYIGGAQGFRRAFDEFKSAVLLMAINRMDIASRIVTELESKVLRLVPEEE